MIIPKILVMFTKKIKMKKLLFLFIMVSVSSYAQVKATDMNKLVKAYDAKLQEEFGDWDFQTVKVKKDNGSNIKQIVVHTVDFKGADMDPTFRAKLDDDNIAEEVKYLFEFDFFSTFKSLNVQYLIVDFTVINIDGKKYKTTRSFPIKDYNESEYNDEKVRRLIIR